MFPTILKESNCSHPKFVEGYIFAWQILENMHRLKELASALSKTPILEEKLALLETVSPQGEGLQSALEKKSLEERLVLKQMALLGHPFDPNSAEFCQQLVTIDRFYREIGGLVGYQAEVLRLLKPAPNTVSKYHAPVFDDISEETPEVVEAIRWGLEALPFMAELYPLGGAADRLHLVDEATGQELPAAKLQFAGRTLLETLIRDLQARERLYFQRYGQKLETPIAIMTSHEKNNHQHVLDILQQHQWFGRKPESFRLFTQPLVPTVDDQGRWHRTGTALLLKPGGHGALWKLAKDEGVFAWLKQLGRTHALIRQINNPAAGLDYGLLAFTGIGWKKRKTFGFASCPRRVSSAEGMNVLVERENGEVALTNVEYCDFAKHGIEDKPLKLGEPFSQFSSNTNILFADLQAIESVVEQCPFPGLLINLKKTNDTVSGRLESTMQNIADVLTERKKSDTPLRTEKTFVTYNHRHKTISVAKKAYQPGGPLAETPELCFYEMMTAHRELLELCGFTLPAQESVEEYLVHGPRFVLQYHPALGPLYSIIRQKLRGGQIARGSELTLELAEADVEHLVLDGSLRVCADQPLGSASCLLHDVVVINDGSRWEPPFWKLHARHSESLHIVLRGNSAFDAHGVTFVGSQKFVVEDGKKLVIRQRGERIVVREEALSGERSSPLT